MDASFQRKIEVKRQATNKENSQPHDLLPSAPVVVLQKEDDRNMPLGEILLDHRGEPFRSIPSWILKEQSLQLENSRKASSSGDQSKYFTEYTENSLPDMNRVNINDDDENQENQSRSFAFDSLEQENTDGAAGGHNPDDTLEELEYVSKNGELNYVPVKNRKESETASSIADDVILIESSPENSFTTAHTNMDSKSIMTTNMSFVTARGSNMTTRSWMYSEHTEEVQQLYDENFASDNQSHSDHSTDTETLPANKNLSNADAPIPDDNHSITDAPLPDFDSTLERVEYLMEMGQQLQAKTASTVIPIIKVQPADSPQPKPKPVDINPGSQLKLTPVNAHKRTPVSVKSAPTFKKPENRPSPLRAKPPIPPNTTSKIPTLKVPSASSKAQFRHIASPVATYIKNTPEIPLIKTVRSTKQLFNPNMGGRAAPGHDYSVLSSASSSKQTLLPKLSLPKKVFKAASNHHVSSEPS